LKSVSSHFTVNLFCSYFGPKLCIVFFPVVSYTLTICCTRVQIQIIFYTVSYASCTVYGANHS